MENIKAFMAFHSTALDKEITAANYAGICTSSVIKEENIDQPVSDSFLLRIKGKQEKMNNLIKPELFFSPRKPYIQTN